jgi:hypothetical protein
MRTVWTVARKLYGDDRAAEVTEMGVVLAMIVAAAVAAIALIGPKVQASYNTTNNVLP